MQASRASSILSFPLGWMMWAGPHALAKFCEFVLAIGGRRDGTGIMQQVICAFGASIDTHTHTFTASPGTPCFVWYRDCFATHTFCRCELAWNAFPDYCSVHR